MGVLECWSIGALEEGAPWHYSITPILQHSIFYENRFSISLQESAHRDHSVDRYHVLFAGLVHAGEPGLDSVAVHQDGFAHRPAGHEEQSQRYCEPVG